MTFKIKFYFKDSNFSHKIILWAQRVKHVNKWIEKL